jgi:NAD(P)-dependent dehydrogenase (short-subunit alcohol dehydrogenase family)
MDRAFTGLLAGKTCIVTGSTSGIGKGQFYLLAWGVHWVQGRCTLDRPSFEFLLEKPLPPPLLLVAAIAASFLRAGAFVFINGRSAETVDRVVATFGEEGLTAVQGVVADLGTAEGCEAMYAAVGATGRQVQVLVNNMGVFGTKDFFEYTDEEWMSYFTTNVMSTVSVEPGDGLGVAAWGGWGGQGGWGGGGGGHPSPGPPGVRRQPPPGL